jgi:hypothetical protein
MIAARASSPPEQARKAVSPGLSPDVPLQALARGQSPGQGYSGWGPKETVRATSRKPTDS